MKVGIIQSNYIPWRGYFDFIRECDLFIIHDDIQYTKGDWRNRNKIKTPQGTRWLTVPVHYAHTAQLICETQIDYTTNWRDDHLNLFHTNYRKARYVTHAFALLNMAFGDVLLPPLTISQLNVSLIMLVCNYLGITTPIRDSREFGLSPAMRKTERILAMCKSVGATTYLSGPAARVYLDEDALRREGIALEYKEYVYPVYPQQHGAFEPQVSVLDLIANMGPKSADYIWGAAKPKARTYHNGLGGD